MNGNRARVAGRRVAEWIERCNGDVERGTGVALPGAVTRSWDCTAAVTVIVPVVAVRLVAVSLAVMVRLPAVLRTTPLNVCVPLSPATNV